MSITATPEVRLGARLRPLAPARTYATPDGARRIQILLGLIWLLDGALQLQSFMYGNGFIQMLRAGATGQPYWIASSVKWAAGVLQSHQVPLNTASAIVQIAIGLGLLHRRTVKPALVVSFAWALVVWWSGEAFGLLFTNTANALTGAPGAVVVYALVGMVVWPGRRAGGLLGVRGSRLAWGLVWVLMGALWLLSANSSANATTALIDSAPSGAGWLTAVQHSVAHAATGDGLSIALGLAGASFAIGIAVARNWHARVFLIAAIVLNVAYWVIGQGLGGVLQGGATDPNAGPVFVLFACALYALVPAAD